jgi:membrane-associated phospholipid phosphatase
MPTSWRDEKFRGTRAWALELVANTGARMRADGWLYIAVAVYSAAGMMVLALSGHTELASYDIYFGQWTYLFLLFMPLVAMLFDGVWIVVRFDERRSLALRRAFSPWRLAHLFSGMALLMALMIFQGTFTSIKNVLPIMRGGFLYDRLLADLDAQLSLGTDPWQLLYSYLQHEAVLKVIDWNYSVLWFVVNFGLLFYVVTSPRAVFVRVRYVMMFMIVWVVCGNIFAGIFISGGPAFYGSITGDGHRFAGQLGFLASNEWASGAVKFQNYLWSLHQRGTSGLGSGISAFPSVHVGLVAMNAFFAAEISHRLGVAAFCYAAFVIASSVYLGWHYAVDGYASLAVVGLCHFGVKWLMQPRRKRAWAGPALDAARGA